VAHTYVCLSRMSCSQLCVHHHETSMYHRVESGLCVAIIVLTNESIVQIVFAITDRACRARTLFHDVVGNELLSVLSEYGIQQDMLPADMGGSLGFLQSEWIENRRACELEEI